MHQAKHIKSLVTPTVWLIECWSVVWPFDLQYPVVPEGEPGEQEDGESERSDSGANGGRCCIIQTSVAELAP